MCRCCLHAAGGADGVNCSLLLLLLWRTVGGRILAGITCELRLSDYSHSFLQKNARVIDVGDVLARAVFQTNQERQETCPKRSQAIDSMSHVLCVWGLLSRVQSWAWRGLLSRSSGRTTASAGLPLQPRVQL